MNRSFIHLNFLNPCRFTKSQTNDSVINLHKSWWLTKIDIEHVHNGLYWSVWGGPYRSLNIFADFPNCPDGLEFPIQISDVFGVHSTSLNLEKTTTTTTTTTTWNKHSQKHTPQQIVIVNADSDGSHLERNIQVELAWSKTSTRCDPLIFCMGGLWPLKPI